MIIKDTLLNVDVNLSTSREIKLSLSPEFVLRWYKNLAEFIELTISNWIFLDIDVVIIVLVTLTLKTIRPFTRNNIQRINNKVDNLGSYPKYLKELFMNSENLSVPTELDIDKLITGIITPKPTNSIIEPINDKVTRRNRPSFDLKKQILKIS